MRHSHAVNRTADRDYHLEMLPKKKHETQRVIDLFYTGVGSDGLWRARTGGVCKRAYLHG